MSPLYFPIGPEGLLGARRFRPARPGILPADLWAVETALADADGTRLVRVATVPHKGGSTLGVRVECDGAAIAYVPDHVPSDDESVLEALAAGVDVLLHDGQFRRGEEDLARAYGQSTIEEAMLIADRCEVGRLVVVHHDPARTDADLDALAATVTTTPDGRPVSFAVEDQPIADSQRVRVGHRDG